MAAKKTAKKIKTAKRTTKTTAKSKDKPMKPITDVKSLLRAKSRKKLPRGTFVSISPGPSILSNVKLRVGSEKGGTIAELSVEQALHDLFLKLGVHVDFDIELPAPKAPAAAA